MFEELIRKAFLLAALFTGVPLLFSSCVGLVISFVQSATQVQEQSMQFLIKLAVVSLVIATGWSWAFAQLTSITQDLLRLLASFGVS